MMKLHWGNPEVLVESNWEIISQTVELIPRQDITPGNLSRSLVWVWSCSRRVQRKWIGWRYGYCFGWKMETVKICPWLSDPMLQAYNWKATTSPTEALMLIITSLAHQIFAVLLHLYWLGRFVSETVVPTNDDGIGGLSWCNTDRDEGSGDSREAHYECWAVMHRSRL